MLSFETTQWTLVVNAAGQGSADAREALGQLCDKYWQPLFEYARRRSRDEATANDSVQSFLARLIEKDTIAVANQERGKFRSFLIVSFKRFLNEKYVRANAQQRGGGQPVISLDQREDDDRKIEAADSLTAEQEFQRQWARTVLKLVMEQLEQDYKKQDRLAQFQQLKPFIAREDGQNYHEVAKQLQMTPSAAADGQFAVERTVPVPVAAGDCSNRGRPAGCGRGNPRFVPRLPSLNRITCIKQSVALHHPCPRASTLQTCCVVALTPFLQSLSVPSGVSGPRRMGAARTWRITSSKFSRKNASVKANLCSPWG